jgi:tungstate transport system ATP-binding protein
VRQSDTPSILTAQGLRFAYGRTPALDIDRLHVSRGSITAIIGHNGCGKTTLFKVISGLLGPYSGSLQFEGIDVGTLRGRQTLRRHAAYVHQQPYIFRERVRANLAFGLKVRRVPTRERRERIERALAAVALTDLASRRADGLSGGERQRVAIARAIALEPSLLLLDEPTSNIDPTSIALIEKAVQDARDGGTTVLLSTHNLATAYRIADHVLPMERGRISRDRNNVYRGELTNRDAGLARFHVPGGSIAVPSRKGDFRAALVPMDDVFLAREQVATSAQNRFRGRIIEIDAFGDDASSELYRVRLDCGFNLDALVTAQALEELGIREGAELFAGFKASAVQLY